MGLRALQWFWAFKGGGPLRLLGGKFRGRQRGLQERQIEAKNPTPNPEIRQKHRVYTNLLEKLAWTSACFHSTWVWNPTKLFKMTCSDEHFPLGEFCRVDFPPQARGSKRLGPCSHAPSPSHRSLEVLKLLTHLLCGAEDHCTVLTTSAFGDVKLQEQLRQVSHLPRASDQKGQCAHRNRDDFKSLCDFKSQRQRSRNQNRL